MCLVRTYGVDAWISGTVLLGAAATLLYLARAGRAVEWGAQRRRGSFSAGDDYASLRSRSA